MLQTVKNLPAMQETWLWSLGWEDPLGRSPEKIPWKREQLPTPVFYPGEFHGQRSLAVYSPWACKESETTGQLSLLLFTFNLLSDIRVIFLLFKESGQWGFWFVFCFFVFCISNLFTRKKMHFAFLFFILLRLLGVVLFLSLKKSSKV